MINLHVVTVFCLLGASNTTRDCVPSLDANSVINHELSSDSRRRSILIILTSFGPPVLKNAPPLIASLFPHCKLLEDNIRQSKIAAALVEVNKRHSLSGTHLAPP